MQKKKKGGGLKILEVWIQKREPEKGENANFTLMEISLAQTWKKKKKNSSPSPHPPLIQEGHLYLKVDGYQGFYRILDGYQPRKTKHVIRAVFQ